MYSLCVNGDPWKKEADSRGFSSVEGRGQRNNKKEGTFIIWNFFFRWLLPADKIENQPATKQMEMWETPSTQTTNIWGRRQVDVEKGQFQEKQIILTFSYNRQDKM